MPTTFLDQGLIDAIASVMTHRVETRGIKLVGERKDLEPAALAVLGSAFPERVEKDRKVVIPDWEHVGNADLVVRPEPGASTVSALFELKWAGPGDDIIYEAIYDLFKLALSTKRDDHPRAYLLTGAMKTHWEKSAFVDLFDAAVHEPEELCRRRLPDKHRRLAWDDLLRGSDDKFPLFLPHQIRTEPVGHAAGDKWELRAVEVRVENAAIVPMATGWPWTGRPEDAEHPIAPTAPEIQIDPATLPENIELMRKLDEQLGASADELE